MKRPIVALVIWAGVTGLAPAQSLRIFTEISPPEQMQDSSGKLSGIGADIVQEIQKRLGNQDPIHVASWARGYLAVQSEPNVLLFTMIRNGDRNPLFQWVGPIKETVCGLWVKSDSNSTVKTLDDAMKFHGIGVYKDDIRDQYLTQHGFSNLIRSSDNKVNLRRLALGDIEAIANSRDEIAFEIKEGGYRPGDFKEVYPFLYLQEFLAFSKGTPKATVEAWQSALDEMKKDKTFEHILHKYLPNSPLPGPAITAF